MNAPEFSLGDTAVLKKPHPCGEYRWEIIRVGADIKLRCLKCSRVIMLDRMDFLASIKRIIPTEAESVSE